MWSVKDYLLAALVILAPFGTRYVFHWGGIAGASSEYGTISLWASQILVMVYVLAVFISSADWKKQISWSSTPTRLLGLFVGLVYLSGLFATNQLDSLQHADWIILVVALILAIKVHQPHPNLIPGSLVAGSIIQSAFIFYQAITQQVLASTWLGVAAHLPAELGTSVVVSESTRWLRAYGTFAHPNLAGFYLAVALLAGIILYSRLSTPRIKLVLLIFLDLITVALILTFSRTAWLSAAFGLGVLLWLHLKNFQKSDHNILNLQKLLPFFTVFATAAVAIILAWPLVHTRATATGQLEQQSINERSTYTQDAINLIKHHPLIGVGPGQMPAAIHDQIDPHRDGWSYQPVHNIPLLLLAELGTISVAILIFILFHFLKTIPLLNPFIFLLIPPLLLDHYLWSFWPGILLSAVLIAIINQPKDLDI